MSFLLMIKAFKRNIMKKGVNNKFSLTYDELVILTI